MNPLERIINTLLLNASFIDNIGLMNGKMGIAIAFYHLARKTGNTVYEDYAGELIDEIHEEISVNTACDFENGLAGIGWGIEYLVQNGFIEADTDEVLEDFDNRMFRYLIYNTPQELGLKNGLVGIGAYFLARIKNAQSNDDNLKTLTNKQLLIHVIDEIERKTQKTEDLFSKEYKVSCESIQLFSLDWDFPLLLWLLSELYAQNIFNFKVEKIIQRMILFLDEAPSIEKHSMRLFLAMSLVKTMQQTENKGLDRLIDKLLPDINRETLKSEIPGSNLFIKNGYSGIAFIYGLLFKLTKDIVFNEELKFWKNETLKVVDVLLQKQDLIDVNEHNREFYGLYEGYSGIILMAD